MSRNGKPKGGAPRYWKINNGALYARLQYLDESGRRREKTRRIEKKRDAKSVVEEMLQEVRLLSSETPQSHRHTFAELADKYESDRVSPIFKYGYEVPQRSSVGPIKSTLKTLRSHFGEKLVRLIKPLDIESFKDIRLATPVVEWINEERIEFDPETKRDKKTKVKVPVATQRNISSVNRELQMLKTIFKFAVQIGWLDDNPFRGCGSIISVASETKRRRVLSYEEEDRLLRACTGRRVHLKAIIICALDTGMSRGELFRMMWGDVDFEKGRIRIPRSKSKPKIGRTVGISERMLVELSRLRERSFFRPTTIVFGFTDNIKKGWKAALREAAIEDFRLNDCRYTATTRMMESGELPFPIEDDMGTTRKSVVVDLALYRAKKELRYAAAKRR